MAAAGQRTGEPSRLRMTSQIKLEPITATTPSTIAPASQPHSIFDKWMLLSCKIERNRTSKKTSPPSNRTCPASRTRLALASSATLEASRWRRSRDTMRHSKADPHEIGQRRLGGGCREAAQPYVAAVPDLRGWRQTSPEAESDS